MTLRLPPRLKKKKDYDLLFRKGKTEFVYPIKMWVLKTENTPRDTSPLRPMFIAPKALYRHAVDRNVTKRRMREAFRLHQHLVTSDDYNAATTILLAFRCVAKEVPDYRRIEKAMQGLLEKI